MGIPISAQPLAGSAPAMSDARPAATDGGVLHVLLVEDNPADARLIEEQLRRAQQRQAAGGAVMALRRVATLAGALSEIDPGGAYGHPTDAVLLDLTLSDSRGLQTFRALHRHAPHVPIVVLSGLSDEEVAAAAVEEGAQDYLVKGRTDGQVLLRAVRYAVARQRAESEREAHLRERAARAEVEAERARLYALFQDAPAYVAILRGPAHVIAFANTCMRQLAGSGRDVAGRPFREAFPELDGQGVFELLDHVYRSGEAHSGEDVALRWSRDGQPAEAYFSYVFQPTRTAAGEVDGVFVHAVEVTARKQAEDTLREAIRIRDEFLAVASHDLKNPLAAVHGTAQMLQRTLQRTGTVPPERLEASVNALITSVGRMTSQIDELLDVARLRLGQALPLERSRTDLVALATTVAASQQAATERHRIVVESAEPTIAGWWDSRRLARVLGNLLSNAVKYSPDGGDVRIAVSRQRGSPTGGPPQEWAILSVTDQGIGIPAADLERVFERFGRAGNVVGRIEGNGIGLAATKHIVEQHGGAIAVTSQEGRGTTFTVRLPLQPPGQSAGAA